MIFGKAALILVAIIFVMWLVGALIRDRKRR
jgi:hypothetical protein